MGKRGGRGGRGRGRSSGRAGKSGGRSGSKGSRAGGKSAGKGSNSGGGKSSSKGSSSKGGRGTGRSTGSAGTKGSRSGSKGSRASSSSPGGWSSSQTGALGAAIAASKAANPGAWSKALSGGGSMSTTTSLSNFTKAVNAANEASYKNRKHIVNPANISKDGSWDIGKAASSFFAATPFSLMPTASADTGIAGDKDGVQMPSTEKMSSAVMTGIDRVLSMGEAKKPSPNANIPYGPYAYDVYPEHIPVSKVDPTGDWYSQYATKMPGMFIPKQNRAAVAVPASISRKIDKYEKIVSDAKELGQYGEHIDSAARNLEFYRSVVKSLYKKQTPDIAIQAGMELEHTHTGEPSLYAPGTNERIIISKADKVLISKLQTDPASLTATQRDQAVMLKAKQDNAEMRWKETTQVPDTVSTLSTPWGSPTGYSLTPYTSDQNRADWTAEGGTNLISAKDSWLKERYTDKGLDVPYWYSNRDRIEMVDVTDDGVPDQLSIIPYEFDTKERYTGPFGDPGEMRYEEVPEYAPAQPYEVPYYVDIPAAQQLLDGGATFEEIMEKPPLIPEYMYWTDPTDKKEYVMSVSDHKEYLQAVIRQKKIEKQRKYDEVFMDVTRGRGPNIQQPIGKRTGKSASSQIQRVMSGTAPSEADIGGLVR